tara:strand:+ start:75 stop:425 length:351 start_codon:yes stop_codon:yes gene_type:complete
VERLWDNLVRGLQDSAAMVLGRADELTRLGRIRLDIAALKSKVYRCQAELGAEVYRRLKAEGGFDLVQNEKVQEFYERIGALEGELEARKGDLDELQEELAGQSQREEAETAESEQ